MQAKIMNNILVVSALKRFLFFLLADVFIICVSLYLSFLVHFEFNLNIRYLGLIREMALFFIVVKVLSLAAFRVYRMTWRYVGISDLVNIFLALFVAELVLLALSLPNAVLPELSITGRMGRLQDKEVDVMKCVF